MEATVIQRGDTPTSKEFYFVYSGELGKGSFIEYESNGKVISRISEVFRANEYFENAENVSESAEDLKQKFPVDEWEVRIARAEIMGRFKNDRIHRVSSSPSPGMEVNNADPDRIEKFLGLDENGLNLGTVQQQEINASVDMTDTLQKHFAILAQSGAGKSYTASVLLEELLDRDYSPAILAVDPHGDYTCFADDENYMQDVKVFNQKDLQIAVNSLSAGQIASFFTGSFSPVQRQELAKVFSALNRGENKDFGMEDVISRVESEEMNDKAKYSLLRKLNQLKSMKIFGKTNKPSSKDLEPGKLNIIDLSSIIDNQKKQIITAFFGKHFFRKRRNGSIPPFLYLLEEAHNFAPEQTPSASKQVIEKMAREGRKFHASIGLISQRPVKLSTTALSQCNTKMVLRVTNPNDLDHIKTSSEGITSEVASEIPGLKTGEGIIMGEAVNHPTFVDVRERKSKESDSGEGLEDALKDWQEEEEKMDEDVDAFM
ncbi:MAG: DNA helicase HerA-like ATPase [Candidatus Nanohaloarchaea archaeon]|jgi:DNA helicase HerA-like ATPase